MTELVKYDAACRALAEAVAVDEVKDILDHAEALRHAYRIAGDKQLEIQAAQLRFRAERRLGELLAKANEAKQISRGQPKKNCTETEQYSPRVKLEDVGIDRKLSSRAQRIAALPAEKFDQLVGQHAEEMRAGVGRIAMDLLKVNAEADGRQARRDLAVALSDAAAELPSGRKYAVIYADPPWHRDQGVTSRSYENHYPTMAWSEICALPVADRVLPDAWLFLWIPRAHAFALHEVETEVTLLDGEVVRARVEMPLAWAVAKAWGFEDYSTALVWTKTDDNHPDEAGGAVLVRDQDELLLMFKRGNGLPKPANGEKFGSNHRERSRLLGHSKKPQHFRRVISTMAGRGTPVLEMFARFDPENPAPIGWDLWGNEAQSSDGGVEGHASKPAMHEPTGRGIYSRPDPSGQAGSASVESGPSDDIAEVSASSGDDAAAAVEIDALPAAAAEFSEHEALKAFSDFCHPRRREICDAAGAEYCARGLAVRGNAGDWILRDAGRMRLQQLDDEKRATMPTAATPPARDPLEIPEFLRRKRPQLDLGLVVPAKPDIVDDHVQTRLPLNEIEIDEAVGLRAIEADPTGRTCELGSHLVGKGWAFATTEKIFLTDEGRAALASFVDIPPAPIGHAEARA